MFLKKKKKKKLSQETIQRHRFGNYELRISEVKVEIEEVVHKLSKHVYAVGSYEYGLFLFLLGNMKETEDGVVAKTEQELSDGLKNVEFLVTMLAHSNLIFSNVEFRQKYYYLVAEIVTKLNPAEISKEDDDAIVEELKTVEQMKEAVE